MEGEQMPVENQVISSETAHVEADMAISSEQFISPVISTASTLEFKVTEEPAQINEVKIEEKADETIVDSEKTGLEVSVPTNVTALQSHYMAAIIKGKPGIRGEKSLQVARDLVESGIQPTEAMMLINLVYGGPNYHPSGSGQGTRLKYFSEAVRETWGLRLENASKHPALFRGILAKVNEATEMRDMLGDEDKDYKISFKQALLFQEVGIDTEYFLGLAETLTSDYNISRMVAKIRIIEAATRVKNNEYSSLEGLLFSTKPSEGDSEQYE